MIVTCLMILIFESVLRPFMHTGFFYRVVAMAIPGVLAGLARASRRRWAASIVIGIYSLFILGCVWILPLFAATPRLGPVYQHVTHFVPPEFPLLLIAPAMALDWLWLGTEQWNPWLESAVSGLVFVVMLAAVQWPFADFLMSPLSRNRVFGTIYFDYNLWPNSLYAPNLFERLEKTAGQFWAEMTLAVLAATLTTRIGIGWGNWMRRIRR